MSEKYC